MELFLLYIIGWKSLEIFFFSPARNEKAENSRKTPLGIFLKPHQNIHSRAFFERFRPPLRDEPKKVWIN